MNPKTKTTPVGRFVHFITEGQWDIRIRERPRIQRVGLYALRLVSLAALGFRRNQCSLHAASLTFFSMMALVPVLVLALALARTFGGADLAKRQLDAQLNDWMGEMQQVVEARTTANGTVEPNAQADVTRAFSEQVREIADKLYEQISSISFGTLGGVGLVMLLWTVIGVLGKVEASFNQVWSAERPRSFVRKFADYLAMIMILPFLFTAVSTVPVMSMIAKIMDRTIGGPTSTFLMTLLHSGLLKTSITLSLGSLTFAFFLGFMPNTRVRPIPALVGGFVTMVLFGGWLKLCAMLQVGIAKYSALYGGFAVLPILLMWVYTSWQIILLGSEIVFAIQNRDTEMQERAVSEASPRTRLLLALALCSEAARRSCEPNGNPLDAETFGIRYGIPHRFLNEVLASLARRGLLAETTEHPGSYLLCRNGDRLTAAETVKALLDDGEALDSVAQNPLDASIIALNKRLEASLESALSQPLTHGCDSVSTKLNRTK